MGVPNPLVKISDGKLMGVKTYTKSGTPYYAFRGIPFAKPPVGDLRFMPPQALEPWDGVRDSTYERNVCLQPKMEAGPMLSSVSGIAALLRNTCNALRFVRTFSKQSEDCLYLNVLTPQLPSSEHDVLKLPVLVWIHGGSFLIGCGGDAFGKKDNLIDRGIVVVSLNYRLGPFGFLSLDTPSAPGNAGMQDQVAALRWVQRHICHFGGDPNRVTVYGISSGGTAAHLLALSPLAAGLLHGVIAASGVALCDWSVTTEHVTHAQELAKLLNIKETNRERIARALKKVPPKDIMKALKKYGVTKMGKTLSTDLVFVPSLELPGPNAFLAEMPETILREGRQAPVPLLTGLVANEGGVWYTSPITAKINISEFDKARQMLMPVDLHNALSEDSRQQVADRIVEFYCGAKGLCRATEEQFINLYGDITFNVPSLLTCHLHASTRTAPVYMYLLTFDGRLGCTANFLKGTPCKGPSHADELGYVAPVLAIPRPRLRTEDPEMVFARRLVSTLVSFIAIGKPTVPDAASTIWLPITNQSDNYLEMGQQFQMKSDFGPRMHFWNNLYIEHLNKSLLATPDDFDANNPTVESHL